MIVVRTSSAFIAALIAHGAVSAQQPPSDKIADYLVDIGPGPVSAAEILGVSATAVTNVQALKDLNVLLKPATGGKEKAAVGLEITPLRTRWSSMTAASYMTSPLSRLLGSTSLSYAKNTAKYGATDYSQQAAGLHTQFYIDAKDDPVVAAHEAFAQCAMAQSIDVQKLRELNARVEERKRQLNVSVLPVEERNRLESEYINSAAFIKLAQDADTAVKACVAKAARAKWNAPLVAATVGSAWIQPDAGGARLTLAKTLSVTGVLTAGANGAVHVSARRARKELDTSTLAASPVFKSHTLLAARYTYRGNEDSDLFGIVEISNAKDSDGTVSNAAFKYAIGLDKRVLEGVWLEFRVGKARMVNGTGDETKALFNVKWSPTPALPTLWGAKQP
jgi:hypothetical protein